MVDASGAGERDWAAECAALRTELDRQAEAARAEQARLTFELGHRVKNTLSMVQALANQTFRSTPEATPALDSFGGRILALARANDTILGESWTSATLEGVARSVLVPQEHASGSVTIEGPTIRIGASAALSFAMALHELATNAKRFGAWSVLDGRVTLSWTLVPGPDGQRLRLVWAERGGPAAETPASRGFGLRYAEQSLRTAFGRDIVFDFSAQGLECRVNAPADALDA